MIRGFLLGDGSGGGGVTSITGEDSIVATPDPITGAGSLNLVNDNAAPGNNQYYGTDAMGDKGYHALPSGIAPDLDTVLHNGNISTLSAYIGGKNDEVQLGIKLNPAQTAEGLSIVKDNNFQIAAIGFANNSGIENSSLVLNSETEGLIMIHNIGGDSSSGRYGLSDVFDTNTGTDAIYHIGAFSQLQTVGLGLPGDSLNRVGFSVNNNRVTEEHFTKTYDFTPPVFTGSGLDDMTVDTSATYTGWLPTITYVITIDGTGTPDTFSWDDGTESASMVPINVGGNTLSNGVVIVWGADTGHTLADEWTFNVDTQQVAMLGISGSQRGIAIGDYNNQLTSTYSVWDNNKGTINFFAAGTNVMTMADAPAHGKVGINNQDPHTAIHVGSGTQTWLPMILQGDGTSTPVETYLDNHSNYRIACDDSNGPLTIYLPVADSVYDGITFEIGSTATNISDDVILSVSDSMTEEIFYDNALTDSIKLNEYNNINLRYTATLNGSVWYVTTEGSYIPVPISLVSGVGLQQITNVGATTTNSMVVTNGTTDSITYGDTFVDFGQGGLFNTLESESLTSNRTNTLQDRSGTLAHIDQIPYQVTTVVTDAMPTPDAGLLGLNIQYNITALATAAAFQAPTGTPVDGQRLTIRITSDPNVHALTWDPIYRDGTTLTLPGGINISATTYAEFIYNGLSSTFDIVSLNQF